MTKKFIIVIFVVAAVAIGILSQTVFKKEESPFSLDRVVRGNIRQEVSAIGTVRQGEDIELGFKSSGRIEKIYVRVGDKVKTNDYLIELETNQLEIQLNQARASLSSAQAALNKLLAGSSPEEIQIAETAVANARIALDNAKRNLENVKAIAEDNLKNAYEDASNVSDDAYLTIYNSYNTVDSVQRSYFTSNDQKSFSVKENKEKISATLNNIKPFVDVDSDLAKMKTSLQDVSDALKIIREVCEDPYYGTIVSSTNKTYLDTHRTNINTALTDVVNSQQTISYTILDNNFDINTAQISLSSAEGILKTAQDNLALKRAGPRQEDIDVYQAQINQAKSQVELSEEQVRESILKSPVDGQIIKINNRLGESVQATAGLIALVPDEPFQVEAEIPEADIGKINLTNHCQIALDAFPEKEFFGKVIEIEPAETIIQGVVYYKIKTSLEAEDLKAKPGMTANLIVITAERENVLMIPQRAIKEKNGKKIVRVPLNELEYKEKEVEIGISASEGTVEIISGLNEGEEIITFIKEKQ